MLTIEQLLAIVKQQYTEHRETSVGPMQSVHVLLEFDPTVQQDIKDRWREAVLSQRLRKVAGAALLVLALVGTIFSYLHVDTLTRGFYTRRLQVAAVLVILAIIALGMTSA